MDKLTISFFKCQLYTALCALLLTACGKGSSYEYKPKSAGKADEILWVMNDRYWEDTLGALVYEKFQGAYGILPQAEPTYLVRPKNFNQFNNDIIRKYRTIVLCAASAADQEYGLVRDLIGNSQGSGAGVRLLSNVWAEPQQVIVITAEQPHQLLEIVSRNADEVEGWIRRAEDRRIDILLYENGVNEEATDLVRERYGYGMNIPPEYYIARSNEDFTWMRLENVVLSSNILMYRRRLDPVDIAVGVDWGKFALNMREYLGTSYISSRVEDSYMTIEDRYAPVLQDTLSILGFQALETRGLWRMENDFMGGPFRNLAWLDTTSMTYNMIDVFVHAPKEGKKKYMRRLDHILSTIAP